MAWNSGFEDAGTYAGDADGWSISITNSLWFWASYGARRWGIEGFESDWGNDSYVWSFVPGDLDAADFDTGSSEHEDFDWWCAGLCTFLSGWDDVTEDAAGFEAGAYEYEDYEPGWDTDPFFPAFVSYIFGVPGPFLLGPGSTDFRVSLTRTGFPTFDATLSVTAGTWTYSALATELQTQVNAALTAAGGAYAPYDVLFYPAVLRGDGYLAVVNTKSDYVMWLLDSDDSGWPFLLGRELGNFDYRYQEEDLVEPFDVDWIGQYNSDTYRMEDFERDWDNIDTTIPWTYMWTWVPWIDGTENPRNSGTQVQILAGVNDTFSIHLRIWGTGNSTSSGVLTVPAGTYPVAAFVVAMQNVINAWLIAAGAPFGAGNVTVAESPGRLSIRVSNTGPSDCVMYLTDEATDLWDFLGMAYDAFGDVEDYPQPVAARWVGDDDLLSAAMFDSGTHAYEDFSWGAT